jgi:Uncharacterized conserved protein (DUF2190)
MTDLSGKSWMAIGETDDPTALIETYEVAAAVTKGDPVYLSADDKISPAASAQECIGIAVESQATVGGKVPVLTRGRVKVKAGGAITRGKAVQGGDGSKRITMLADQVVNEAGSGNYTVYYNRKLGTALETTSAADDLLFIIVGR